MIPLAKPDLRQEDIKNAVRVLNSGMLVQGENVSALEDSLSRFTGIENCSLCSSGTAALHLAIKALKIGAGDSVIVPAFTFPASANVVEQSGAETILCDVGPDEYNITPEGLEKCINISGDDLKAVMVVHEFGCPARIREVAELCRKHGLFLIEDAACALGTVADNYHVGFYSDIACFSFHPRKAVTCGEGGAVLTRSKELGKRIKVLRNHGMYNVDGKIDFIEAGFNYRLTDFQAALIHGQLQRFTDELEKRTFLAELYFSHLDGCDRLRLPLKTEGHSWQSFMVVLDSRADRDSIIKHMGQKGVQVNLGAQALNCLSYFSEKYNIRDRDYPVAANLFFSGMVIPLYGSMTEYDIRFVSTALKECLEE